MRIAVLVVALFTINLRQSVAVFAASLVVGVTLTTASTVYAQQLPVRIYTTADGLAHDHVRRIVLDDQSHRGCLNVRLPAPRLARSVYFPLPDHVKR